MFVHPKRRTCKYPARYRNDKSTETGRLRLPLQEMEYCRRINHGQKNFFTNIRVAAGGCPLARELDRRQRTALGGREVIDAARSRNIAIEINDTMHVPHEAFIRMARSAGLKFTFGSDARNHTVGRLDYCQRMARQCRLTEKDFFIPGRPLG